MQVLAYLHAFNGRCEEAIHFYQQTLNAEVVMLMRFKDSPEPMSPDCNMAGMEDRIMHATLHIGEGVVMMSDGGPGATTSFQGFSLSLNPASQTEAERIFAALADGGQIQMPLGKTFWSPMFGMVADRFGVAWMVNLEA
jgi:PhnB protein